MPEQLRSDRVTAGDDDLVMSLVEQALDRPAEDREKYVREECAARPSLVETVLKYVEADERMKGFLLQPLYRLPAEPTLEAGQLLENRFFIVRKVAAGGMGVVYEAMDQKLGRRIAVKCAKAGFHARLPPEVRHASDINHRNVCKTWEIHTASTPQGGLDFLTMEFIEGETLAERLRHGPLPIKEARNIANQLCAGLAAAHRQQVIHGDLKANNVLLTRDAEGIRAVITDFGLARAWMAQDPAATSGDLGGTPGYMAPELLKRGRPSAASDIYALGVILNEMGPAALKRRWARIIARCLEPDPAGRYASVSDVAAALVPFPWLGWSAIAAAVVIAATAGAIGYRTVDLPGEVVRLAVLPFATDPDSKSLSEGLLEDTADRLRRVKDDHRKLTVIPIRDATRNKVDSPEKAVSLLGATHILTGTVRRHNGRFAVHAVLTDARSKLQLKGWDAEYQPAELRNLPVALAGIVTGTLRLPPLAAAATVNAAAYPDFAAGVGLLQRDSIDAALPLLERAVAADPDSPLTHARLAEARARQYRENPASSSLDPARKSLQDAERRNPDLSLIWVVAGRIDEYQGLYEAAEADLKRALEIDSRDGDAWRRLGRVYEENNRFDEAVTAFQRAIDVQPDYFLNYQDLCDVYIEQANYGNAVQPCRKVVQLAPDLSEAHYALALNYFESGDHVRSESEFLLSMKLDPKSATAVYAWAFALTSEGRAGEAIPLFKRAIGIGPATHLLYSDLGTAYRLAGFGSEAKQAYRKGLDMAEVELEKNPRDAIMKAQLAYLCARVGERSRAKSEAIQARQLASSSVEVAWWLMLTWDALGDRNEAFAILDHVPDDTLRRLNRDADLADLRRSSRFQELISLHHIQ